MENTNIYIVLSLGKEYHSKLIDKLLEETKIPYEQIMKNNNGNYCILFRFAEPINNAQVDNFIKTSLTTICKAYDLESEVIECSGEKIKIIKNRIGPNLTMDRLCLSLFIALHNRYTTKHYKEQYKRLATLTGVVLRNGIPLIDYTDQNDGLFENGALEVTPILYTYESTTNAREPFRVYFCTEKKNGKYLVKDIDKFPKELKKNVKLEKILSSCRLCREFSHGDTGLMMKELIGFATNFTKFNAGGKIFTEMLTNKKNLKQRHYDKVDYDLLLKYIFSSDIPEMKCDHFCRYKDSCNHAKTPLKNFKTDRGIITPLVNTKLYSCEEAEQSLKTEFNKILANDDGRIHILEGQTAIGKTTILINYLKNCDEEIVIAAPTNKLKKQIYKDAIEEGIDIVMSPSANNIKNLPKKIKAKINELYECNANVDEYLMKINEELNHKGISKYLKKKQKYLNGARHIVTTHANLLLSDPTIWNGKKIIIDEDILLKNMMPISEITAKNISKIKGYAIDNRFYSITSKIKYILGNRNNKEIFNVKPISKKERNRFMSLMMKQGEKIPNVSAFLDSSVVAPKLESEKLTGLTCLVKRTLPEQTILILSATANEKIYKRYFGEDMVVFHRCKKGKYKGKLLQYPISCSRAKIDKDPEIFDRIRDKAGESKKITFKKYAHLLTYEENPNDLHPGNVEGHNCYTGKDISVIGTPHINELQYKMIASALEYSTKGKLAYREIEYNNCRFYFMTYKNEDIREVQLWVIGSEIEQMVGRARLLRNKCTVFLFSNFPMEQAEFIYDKV